ncbi:MAG: hypothetical protein ACREKH_02505 [Candidatus Rokuibacteriota bacterium]
MLLKRSLVVLAGALVLGCALLLTLPTEDACRASGRLVDSTHHHCVAATGSVELREHILGHALDPVVCIPTTGLVALGLWAAARTDRRRKPVT